jgi:RNA polymerase sigma factor (sigma-70 family)
MNISFRSEDDIINAIKVSENVVFKWIYKKYFPMIQQLILTNSGTIEDAKDIFQIGVILLHEKIKDDSYDMQSSLKTFFYSICRNQWLKKLKQSRMTERITDTHKYANIQQIEDIDNGFLPLSEMQEILQRQFVRLDKNCQKLLKLFYYDNLSMTLIAERTGYTNANNAKTQKYRCIQKLQGLMIPFTKLEK